MIKKNDLETLRARLAANAQAIEERRRAAAEAVVKFTDATGAAREKLAEQVTSLRAEAAVLESERKELQERYTAAYLLPFEAAVRAAQEQTDALGVAAMEARRKVQAAGNDRLRFLNRGGRSSATEESEKLNLEMEIAYIRQKAEGGILQGKAERAAFALQRAKNELEAARTSSLTTLWPPRACGENEKDIDTRVNI